MKNCSLLFLLVLSNLACAQSSSKAITEVSQNELISVILVDVRTPEEYDAGHLENAKNINWYDQDFAERFKGISKDETIYVYCKKGGRSAKARQLLDSLGYKKVIDLEGGYDALSTQKK